MAPHPTRDVLLDTGPLVAALDASDAWHRRCADVWPTVAERCLTTEAVVTEACHFVARGGAPAAIPVDFLLAARIPIVGLDPANHRYASRLMHRYADTPMDYADATLVVVADALRVDTVFTLDRRGFAAYRRAGGGAFELLPVP